MLLLPEVPQVQPARRPPSPAITLPDGDVFAAHPMPEAIDQVLRDVHDSEVLGRILEGATSYQQEALVHRAVALGKGIPRGVRFGIPEKHPLFELRERQCERAGQLRFVEKDSALIIWGASVRAGQPLYSELGTLTRSPWLRLHYRLLGLDAFASLLRDWARFSGVRSPKTCAAVEELIRRQLLHLHQAQPRESYARLDLHALQLAERLGGADRRLAFFLFVCLCRIAFYRVGDEVEWRSSWFRGETRDPYAIPRIGTYEKVIKPLLFSQVLERVGNYRVGVHASTYRIKCVLNPGSNGPVEAARYFHVDMSPTGEVLPARERRSSSS